MSGSRLDGAEVDEVYADLTARRRGVGVDLTNARHLAREWLRLPANPNGRTNADVLKLWVNGMALTRRPAGKRIVDFGLSMSAGEAAMYEEPFR